MSPLREYGLTDLEEALARRGQSREDRVAQRRLEKDQVLVEDRVRRAATDAERWAILRESGLPPVVQGAYFKKWRTPKVRGAAVADPGQKKALAALPHLPDPFFLRHVREMYSRAPWAILERWGAAGRIAPTGRAGEWRKL